MTSLHPAVSCACPKCQSERRTTPTPTPATDEREAVARALCIAGEEDDFNYKGYLELADAALSTLAQIRAAEILAAEASERARLIAWARVRSALNHQWAAEGEHLRIERIALSSAYAKSQRNPKHDDERGRPNDQAEQPERVSYPEGLERGQGQRA